MAYLSRAGSPISAKDFSTIEDAIADLCKPTWAGAPPQEITWVRDGAFKNRGDLYEVNAGENPKAARARIAAAAPVSAPVSRARWTSRDSRALAARMHRADSDL